MLQNIKVVLRQEEQLQIYHSVHKIGKYAEVSIIIFLRDLSFKRRCWTEAASNA